PDRRSDDGIEKRREVSSDPPDQRAPVLGEAARKRRVDVLVRQVVRGRSRGRREETAGEAGQHDPGQPDPARDGGNPRECAGRNVRVRTWGSNVDGSHASFIGTPTPERKLRFRSARKLTLSRGLSRAVNRDEELAVRA